MLLKDKVAVVYGGSGAVGSAVVRAFAREGAVVHLVARRLEPIKELALELSQGGARVHAGQADALEPEAVAAHLDAVVQQSGPVKIAFSAVDWGDSQGEDLVEHDFETFMRPVQTGLKTWFNIGTAYARHMGEDGGGVILGFTANAARQAFAQMGGSAWLVPPSSTSCDIWRWKMVPRAFAAAGCARPVPPIPRASARFGLFTPKSGHDVR